MAREKQGALGDELFGTPMAAAGAPEPDLDAIQADSEAQPLPDQEKLFRPAPAPPAPV